MRAGTLWPRTLFGRNLLLMVGLLLAGVAITAAAFRVLVQGPNARQYAVFTALQVQTVAQALAAVPTAQRPARVAVLGDGLQTRWAEAPPPGARFAEPPSYMLREFLDTVRARLPPGTRVLWQPDDLELWIELPSLAPTLWLVVSGKGLVRDVSLLALWVVAGSGVLALLGASLIGRRINRPLRDLAAAAQALGDGRGTPAQVVAAPGAPAEIAELTARFNAMALALQRSDDERALMLAGISHDLRTPLAKLQLGVETLARADEAETAERMRRACVDIEAVLGQFMDYARLGDAASLRLQPGVDLRDLCEQVAAGFGELQPALALELEAVPPICADGTALQRALVNLIGNALKHGGAPPVVTLRLRRAGSTAQLSVLDRGPGIEPADAERLLRPFTQGDVSRGSGGTGLGLAIVERVARAHGGGVQLLPRDCGGLEAGMVVPLA